APSPAPFVPQTNIVETRVRGTLSWSDGPMSANAAVNYSGRFGNTYTRPVGGVAEQRVKPFVTLDLRGSYELPDRGLMSGSTISVNVDNTFNERPPFQLIGGAYAANANP